MKSITSWVLSFAFALLLAGCSSSPREPSQYHLIYNDCMDQISPRSKWGNETYIRVEGVNGLVPATDYCRWLARTYR